MTVMINTSATAANHNKGASESSYLHSVLQEQASLIVRSVVPKCGQDRLVRLPFIGTQAPRALPGGKTLRNHDLTKFKPDLARSAEQLLRVSSRLKRLTMLDTFARTSPS